MNKRDKIKNWTTKIQTVGAYNRTQPLSYDILDSINNGLDFFTNIPSYNSGIGSVWHESQVVVSPRTVRQAMKRLVDKKLITISDDGSYQLCKKGKTWLEKKSAGAITIAKSQWDGKWRIVIFDIPEPMAGKRRDLAGNLKRLGFLRTQLSVFVYPYECKQEIYNLVALLGIEQWVMYMQVDDISGERKLKKHFKLDK